VRRRFGGIALVGKPCGKVGIQHLPVLASRTMSVSPHLVFIAGCGRDLEEAKKNLRDPSSKMGVNWGLHTP
jgi:hypothetical protein